MVSQQSAVNTEQGNITGQSTGRPVIRSTEGVISSGHYLTSMAGMKMLLNGGNAFDALVAAGFAAAVVEPIASYSLAAEGVFMLYDARSGELLSLSGQGTAPGKATPEFYKSQGLERIPTGPGHRQSHLSFTLPGVVHAFLSLAERYGTKNVDELLAPAIGYAANGIPNYEYMLNRLDSRATAEQFDLYSPGGWDVFYDNRQIPDAGTPLVQPGLANTLRAMLPGSGNGHALSRVEGIQKARDVFYTRLRGEDDCGLSGQRRRHHVDGRPSRLQVPVRNAGQDHVPRVRDLRSGHLDTGPGPDADPEYAGELRPAGHGPQQPGLYPHGGRGHQAVLRRPGGPLRRPGLLHHTHRRLALEGIRRRARPPD